MTTSSNRDCFAFSLVLMDRTVEQWQIGIDAN